MDRAYGSGVTSGDRTGSRRAPGPEEVTWAQPDGSSRRGAQILDLDEFYEAVFVPVDQPEAATGRVQECAAVMTAVTAVDVDHPSDEMPDDVCGGHRPPPFRRVLSPEWIPV